MGSNQYRAWCAVCGTRVEAGKGDLLGKPGSWRVVHRGCNDARRTRNQAGASAQREFERRRDRRDERIQRRLPRVGKLVAAILRQPQSTTSWTTGAEGERKVGARLDQIASDDVIVLHDRRLPSSRANIDHLVIAPSGVWVIDTKRYESQRIERRTRGLLRTRELLYVGGRDRTDLAVKAADAARVVGRSMGEPVGIHPVLCFVDGDLGMFQKPFTVEGVTVTWSRSLVKRLRDDGSHSRADVQRIGAFCDRLFPPA
jgi:hypothetical protein